MNLNYLVKRWLGRATCELGRGAVLYPEARIRNALGDSLAIRIGEFSHIKGELLTFGHGGRITIGRYCFLGHNARIWSALNIEIGDRTLVSHDVNIFDNLTHPISAKARHEQFRAIIAAGQPKSIDLGEKPVRIGNDVLIGCMSVVLRGVTIGDGAIVGAGSVVTGDLPPWTIAAGNPARVIREIATNER